MKKTAKAKISQETLLVDDDSTPMSQTTCYLGLGFGILCLSSSSIIAKHLELSGIPLLVVATYRVTIGAIFSVLTAWFSDSSGLIQTVRSHIWAILLAAVLFAAASGTSMLSLQYIPVGRSVLLLTCNPIFLALGNHMFFGDRLSMRDWSTVFLVFGGIVVIILETSWGFDSHTGIGDFLALTGCLAMSAYVIVGRKWLSEVNGIVYRPILYALSALMLFIVAFSMGSWTKHLVVKDYLWLILLTCIPSSGSYTALKQLLKDMSSFAVSLAAIGEPLCASLLAWLLWQQMPSDATLRGGILVLTGLCLLERRPAE